ncbi:circadian clock KaiB family protein [Mucilaginibacter sp. CAU 1740]|uniref:circadian clock KaiB family protein n=1 Tax=Mucilaginibacter sp. CAU 1740 TaxID=3140365 RepID=UPI00325B7B78
MEKEKYKLCLYVAGNTQKSRSAITNLERYCKEHLADHYTVEVIDLREHPHLAEGKQIIATPTLIKKLPEPIRILVGDLSDQEKFLVGLDLKREG